MSAIRVLKNILETRRATGVSSRDPVDMAPGCSVPCCGRLSLSECARQGELCVSYAWQRTPLTQA